MNKKIIAIALLCSILPLSNAFAATDYSQNLPFSKMTSAKEEQNVVTIQSSAQTNVEQNYLTMTLSYSANGQKSEIVQNEVAEKINSAIASAKKFNKDNSFKVKSGQFGIYPKYQDQNLIGWTGNGSIILEGTDFALITKVASEIEGLTVSNIQTSVSPELINEKKTQTVESAIENFKSDAMRTAKQFGFDTYQIKSISINYDQPNFYPRAEAAMLMMNRAPMAKSAPNVEAGDQTISANVSGSIILTNIIR
jgi:predicted secreted protein